jgi:ribonuclease D
VSWEWVQSAVELEEVITAHRGAKSVAIDTEFRRRDTFFPIVALVQLCWGDKAYLVDPLQAGHAAPLRELLINSTQTKFIHSASEDLEVFSHWLGVLPAPLFDTQRAAALLGMDSGMSYRAMVADFFEIELPKDETQSDWLQRPLSDSQADYAAQDVIYLHPIGNRLLERATALDRALWVLEDGARMTPGGRAPITKFKSAYKLSDAQQCVLVAAVDWREAEARRLDRPRSWILGDKVLTAIARSVPRSVRELSEIPDIPGGLVRRAGEHLIAAISAALEGDFPSLCSQIGPIPLSGGQRQLLGALSEQLGVIATALGIAPAVLMPKADLEHLVRQQSDISLVSPAAWSGWRGEVVVDPLRHWLLEATA